ncbi:MAG: MBL fold metallo-hydrolase, partial [Lachnospiraceae bacterium]|nr:MBL fold metallo-hydrolase [Lachnospiraceae bacterium]
PDYVKELAEIIQETFDRGGNVVIPSFAVGRTQEMLFFLREIKAQELIKGHDGFKVFVDSPLAVEATEVFQKNIYNCFSDTAMELVRQGLNPLLFPGLNLTITSEESKEINFDPEPKVIISASGMCEAGRIRHHLKHNLWREECTILFVGYQAVGTLGRILVEGIDEVKLFGEPIEVNADIRVLAGMSGHADKNGLINWINAFQRKPQKVFIVHGEDSVCNIFADCLKDEYGYDTYAPFSGSIYDLLADEVEYEASPKPVEKKDPTRRVTEVFARLLAAGNRLLQVIERNQGGANKDLAKFADQINSLCDKWDR